MKIDHTRIHLKIRVFLEAHVEYANRNTKRRKDQQARKRKKEEKLSLLGKKKKKRKEIIFKEERKSPIRPVAVKQEPVKPVERLPSAVLPVRRNYQREVFEDKRAVIEDFLKKTKFFLSY